MVCRFFWHSRFFMLSQGVQHDHQRNAGCILWKDINIQILQNLTMFLGIHFKQSNRQASPICSFIIRTRELIFPTTRGREMLVPRRVPNKTGWNFTDLSGPARFGQAKTFQSPEARSMRRRLRKGALKGKAEAEAECPTVREISSDGCPTWTYLYGISHKRFFDYRDSFVGFF